MTYSMRTSTPFLFLLAGILMLLLSSLVHNQVLQTAVLILALLVLGVSIFLLSAQMKRNFRERKDEKSKL